MSSTSLPEKVTGKYWLQEYYNKSHRDLIAVEGINGQWYLKSGKQAKIIEKNGKILKYCPIEPMAVYEIVIESRAENAFVYTAPITSGCNQFKKILFSDDVIISIGRDNDNQLIYDNAMISRHHAILSYVNKKWYIEDNDSGNGVFLNDERVLKSELGLGDVINIMGLIIIIGSSFIAYNSPNGNVTVNMLQAIPFMPQVPDIVDEDADEFELSETTYFYRSPRFKRDIEELNIKIDSPPQDAIGDEMPLMMVIGPSMTMGLASMTSAIFAINNAISSGNMSSAVPSIAMSCSMLLGTVMWPVISKRYEKKRKYKKEQKRQQKYREYLNKISIQLEEACEKQEEILRENYVPIEECERRIRLTERNLWERGFGQNDFLELRLGLGNSELKANIVYSERKFSIDNDNLQEELYNLCERPKILKNVPIIISLFEKHISGVIGERSLTKQFANSLILQLAALYGYDEVKLVFLFDKEESQDFEYVKWLPHVWSDDNKFRFLATDKNEVKELSAYLKNVLEYRNQLNPADLEEVTPYFVIFALSKNLSNCADVLKQIYKQKKKIMFSIITFFDEIKNLPKECSTVVELENSKTGKVYDKSDINGNYVAFIPEFENSNNLGNLSRILANTFLDVQGSSYLLPSMMTFLEMFGVGKVEHLNARTRWMENNPTMSLEAAIGVDELGEPFKLDLHEKFHGPHGLVAGMTGSGKSELIITLILSLAVNYHPNEVAFILIDYKGGGMAKAFEHLPHTAGVITNLDGSAIKRSLVSVESELKRRQAIFAEASKLVGVSNIDIYKYQKLYREGTVTEPLPHLFIISDEFAELKAQQSEFMTQLVSAARIGRSLGVHLILATQKPSGVVDDQIWSNSKFKICLKVQDRSDSMDMLKRPDAAELTDTGRFYLQVGYNELFELGQSAWAGAPYYPSDKTVEERDNSVTVINHNGQQIKKIKIDNRRQRNSNPKKQLDVVTAYLQNIAEEENIHVRKLWLEPIPAIITLDSVKEKYHAYECSYILNPVIGELDDPANQRQRELRLPLTEDGNVIVYGTAGSGKTTFLNTMVSSLIQEHTAEELNIYMLDFASETLGIFAQAPQVGDVIYSYESEKISNLFKMLQSEMEYRRKLFSSHGGNYSSYMNETGNHLPNIVVAINNFAAFIELYEEMEQAVTYLTREGTKYGMYFVLTAISVGTVRFRLLQNFKQLFVLQLNDSADYATVVGKTEGLLPAKYKGRGLVRTDALYEFQIAYITEDGTDNTAIKEFAAKLNQNWNGIHAKRIPILPEHVNEEFLANYITCPTTIPIGVEKQTLHVYQHDLKKQYITHILSATDAYVSFLSILADFMVKYYKLDVTVIDPKSRYQKKDMVANLVSGKKACEDYMSELYNLVLYRNNTYKDTLEQGVDCEAFEQKVFVICSVVELKDTLSNIGYEKLGLFLERGEKEYNISVFIGERAKDLANLTVEKWYKKQFSSQDGIWIGGGIAEQYYLKAGRDTGELHEEITDAFGYVLAGGKPRRLKLLALEQDGEMDE